jgi:hypothetical protein
MIVIFLGLGIMLAILTATGSFVSWILSPTDWTGKKKEKEKDESAEDTNPQG